MNDYVIEHNPTESSAGGTLLHVNKKYLYQPRNDFNIYKLGHPESIFVEIILPKRSNIIIGCIYRHPSMDICTFNDNCLNPLQENFSKENAKKVFLVGDRGLEWKSYSVRVEELFIRNILKKLKNTLLTLRT